MMRLLRKIKRFLSALFYGLLATASNDPESFMEENINGT